MADTTKSASATVTVTAPGSSTVLLGDQNVEGQADSSLPLGQAEAFQATANSSGNVQSLVIYLDSTSTVSQAVAGLYADAGGHPGALLNQGNSTQVVPGAWNTIALPSTSVVAGTPYGSRSWERAAEPWFFATPRAGAVSAKPAWTVRSLRCREGGPPVRQRPRARHQSLGTAAKSFSTTTSPAPR
jgi:hypothetical protein